MKRLLLPAALSLLCLTLPVSIAGINIAAVLLSAAVLASRPNWKDLDDPVFYAAGFYCLAAALSGALGVSPHESFGMLNKDLHKLWILGILLLALSREPAPELTRPLAAGFALIALVGIFQAARDTALSLPLRSNGFVHPVTYGEILGLGLLGGLCFLGHGAEPKRRDAARGFIVLCATALVFNQTRGAFLGVLAGFAAVAVLDRSLRRSALKVVAVAALVAAAWEVMPTAGRSMHDMLVRYRAWQTTGRINPEMARYALWKVALKIFRDHPLTGVGPGGYRLVFHRYFPSNIDSENPWGSAHNLYLHQLAERGLLGLTALAALLGSMTATAWRRARERPNAWNLWAVGTMVAFLVMNLTEVAFQNEQAATLILFIWAWGRANAAREPGEKIL